MNQLKIVVEPNQHGTVNPETVRIIACDPKRRVEVELQTVTGLRLESVLENGRHHFRAQLVVIDPALDIKVPVEQIDVVGDRNYALKQEGGDELARHLTDELAAKERELARVTRELEGAVADKETYVKAAAEANETVKTQFEYIKKLEAAAREAKVEEPKVDEKPRSGGTGKKS